MMRKSLLSHFLVIIIGLSMTVPGVAQKYYKDIKYPKMHKLKIPKVERVELDNGIILFLLEDHELPLINLSARIGVGSIYDPRDKIGLASLTGQVMRTGGTTRMTGDEIDEALESIAGSVETSIGLTSGSAAMSVLKEHLDQGLSILADVLMHPAFAQDKLELAKIQARSAIARRNDEPFGISFREFSKLIYGPQSPYARHTEYATIDAISREDLVAFHKQFFHPNNVIIGVWGDFETKDMIKKIESAFSAWEPVEFERPQIPEVDYKFDWSVNLVKKKDINQTHIRMGHIGGLRSNPDYFALTVMNNILGGGFTSRLFKNVRSRMGLAYSVFGAYSANYDYPGMFYVGCQTKAETTVEALNALRNEVEKMTKELVTDQELAQAKESYLNSFVFNFDTRREVVNRLMTYEYYGYPKDFLQKTKENIEKVTKEDVLRVAQKYLHPDKLRILAVGNPEKFDKPLSNLGEVREIDITIPVPKEEAPEATEESIAEGKELLGKVIKALGGEKSLQAIQSIKVAAQIELSMGGQTLSAAMTDLIVYPDKQWREMQMPFGKVLQVLNGNQGWAQGPQGVVALNASQLEEMKKNLLRDPFLLLGNASH
jgi:predicted Zn-dependent peptidase